MIFSVLKNIKQREHKWCCWVQLLSLRSMTVTAKIISSPGTMFTRWQSSMLTQRFTVPLFYPPSKILSCSLSPSFSLSFSPSLWYGSLLGTDQVYDPVIPNQNKAQRRETKCSFVEACSFVFCHNQCISIFRHYVLIENVCFRVLEICSFAYCWIQSRTMCRLMKWCNLCIMSSSSIKKSRADKIPCLVFPILSISASLNCGPSRSVEWAVLGRAGGQDIEAIQPFILEKVLSHLLFP